MADPLTLLRRYYVNKKEIIERDDQIIFDKFSWPKNVKTNYLIYGSSRNKGAPKEYYTLESLLYLLKNIRLSHPVYVQQATAENIIAVRRPDRKDLLAYLKGDKATSASIDKSAPLETPTQVKRPAEDILESGSKKPRFEETHVQKINEELATRLDHTPKEFPIENIISLSEAIPVEKISTINAKRLDKKRTIIEKNDKIGMGTEPTVIMNIDVDDTKYILSRERQWRTRTTILQSNDKVFAKNIFAILLCIKIREERKQKSSPITPAPMVTPGSTPLRPLPQPAVYNRYDQERFIHQEKETEGFKIDTMGTYYGMTLKFVTEGLNPAAIFQPSTPMLNPSSTSTSGFMPNSAVNFTQQQAAQNEKSSKIPIIIIPSANTSLITMYNAKDILQDLKYVSNEEKINMGAKRENEFLLQKRKGDGLTNTYRVIDNPQNLTNDDWKRVVAVFVVGPAWQFKGWPNYNGNPVEIFSKICAFHIKLDEMQLDANVARWAVTVIELSKTKRHLNRVAIMKFWEVLDKQQHKLTLY